MPQWLLDLIAGWPMIMANLPIFLAILALIIFVVWVVVNWSYRRILASKNAQIELQDRQLADYKQKLDGATPDQARQHIDRLEARLALVEPRRLTPAVRTALAASLRPPHGTQYAVLISIEISGDSHQYGADFVEAFRQATGWTVAEKSILGINRPPSGIAVSYLDSNHPPPAAILVMTALRSVGIQFDIQQRGGPGDLQVEIVVAVKFSG